MLKPIIAVILLAIAIFTLSRAAHGQAVPGASYIGMCSRNFPCERALRVFDVLEPGETKAIGYLHGTFGSRCGCVVKFLSETAGPKYVRVHLADGTCFPERGRSCLKGSVFRGERLLSAEKKVLRRDGRMLARFRKAIFEVREQHKPFIADSSITFRYSPCLECPFGRPARRVLHQVARRYLPGDSLVDSPLQKSCLDSAICEQHGDEPRVPRQGRCITDLDGISIEASDLTKFAERSRNCEAMFYWSFGFNLLPYNYSGPFIPPMARGAQATEREFEALEYCLDVRWF